MSSQHDDVTQELVAHVVGDARSKGVRLWSENGALRYRSPKGVLSKEDFSRLRALSGQIVLYLEASSTKHTTEPKLGPRRSHERIPLTYSQLKYWHGERLHSRPSIRTVSSATRLRGRLDVDALRRSIEQLIRRHESLRTHVVLDDDGPRQHVTESCECDFEIIDLSPDDGAGKIALEPLIHDLILTPVRVGKDPLLGMRLVRLNEGDHVLITAMEHLISDAFSMNILLRDLFTLYVNASGARSFLLPPMPLQLGDYAVWQMRSRPSWQQHHQPYWDECLRGIGRTRFPNDDAALVRGRRGWGKVPVYINASLKAQLRDWCRLRRTTLVMSVFTAFVALVLRWCDESRTVIRYQTDGRFSSQVENTIGYLASVLNLRVELHAHDSFADLLLRVTEEYCKAHEHADFSLIDATLPRPEFTSNPAFNWVPEEARNVLADEARTRSCIDFSPVPFNYPIPSDYEGDYEPTVVLFDRRDEISGSVCFPFARFTESTMERFAANLQEFVSTLLRQPERRVRDLPLR